VVEGHENGDEAIHRCNLQYPRRRQPGPRVSATWHDYTHVRSKEVLDPLVQWANNLTSHAFIVFLTNKSCISWTFYRRLHRRIRAMDHSNPERMFDQFQIKSLHVRERYYRDTSQWQKLRDSFHPDANKTKINISW
jgi:hypothetical protein